MEKSITSDPILYGGRILWAMKNANHWN